jgi:signal peptide peptidase SppA
MSQFASLRRAMNGRLWYVHEQKMNEILAFLEMKFSGGHVAADALAEIRASNQATELRAKAASSAGGGTVAVIPIYGLIMHRPAMDLSGPGGTSCTVLSRRIREAANDPNISAIVMDVDSPGGDTDGVDELATEIYNARKQKKITAVSNCLNASAAYYLSCQASEVVVSPSSMTGSIGVYCVHEDDSEMLTKLGVKLSLIKFGDNKAEGNPYEPLTASAREHLQEMVDTFGGMFEKAVARGRGVSRDEVHSKFGQGRVFDAKTAVRIGMADRVGTLDEVLSKYGAVSGSSQARASENAPAISAEVAADARRRQLALAGL